MAIIAAAGLLADQASKYLVTNNLTEGTSVPIIGDFLIFHFVKNPGAAFSLASGSTWIFSILASAVVVAIIVFARRGKIRSRAWAVMIGLLLGGVLGNLTDRLFREPSFGLGHVVDFIFTPWMLPAIYNVADILICSAMGLFLILSFMGVNLDGTRAPSRAERRRQEAAERDGAALGAAIDATLAEADAEEAAARKAAGAPVAESTDPSVSEEEPHAKP
ncbi:signal peptidase II [Mycetocola tolaasinivorans]|uniref:Lipoprotein signal peptidase n=1 Tax=Mycetocola tolaasinivorans TaxID=76635 RepID=A0A3L7ACI7_9MICO|nr:signal peptidase II [Mycetocola tolaasinivorans]